MSFFVKACIAGLKEIPNAMRDRRRRHHLQKLYDIGTPVGTDRGLVVPVVARRRSQIDGEIDKEIGDLGMESGATAILEARRAAGATFTISNGGVYGSLMSNAYPQRTPIGILADTKSKSASRHRQTGGRPPDEFSRSATITHRRWQGSCDVLVRVKEGPKTPSACCLPMI